MLSGVLYPRLRQPRGAYWLHRFKALEVANLVGLLGWMLYQALEPAAVAWACWAEPAWLTYSCAIG